MECLKRKWFYLALGFASLNSFILMLPFGGKRSFWFDELAQVNLAMGSFRNACLGDMAMPPLYNILTWLWYRVVPYGEGWLRLFSIILVAIGVYVVGLCGKQIKNERTGLIAAFLSSINLNLLKNAGLDFRCYSLFFFTSALLLYVYIIRLTSENKFTWVPVITLGVIIALAGYTHYFNVFMSGILFLLDCYLFKKKKADKRVFISYATAVVLYIPWIYCVLRGSSNFEPWQPKPEWRDIPVLVKYLCGGNNLLYVVFCMGIVVVCYRFIVSIIKRTFKWQDEFVELVPAVIVVLLIGCVFAYGRCIAWLNTFWVNRYFLGLIACVALLSALGIEYLCAFVEQLPVEHPRAATAAVFTAIYFILLVPYWINNAQARAYYPYREAVEWLYEQQEYINNHDTLVIESWDMIADALNEYYITRQGERSGFSITGGPSVTEQGLLENNRVYVSYIHTEIANASDQVQFWLDKHYTLVEDNQKIKVRIYDKKE